MKGHPILKIARKYCLDHQIRLTPPRQYVLDIIATSTAPMGAYDILGQLGHYIDNPKPPTAYRAIDFWRQHGFIHRIESLNAYILCCNNHNHRDTHFLICDDCRTVEEVHMDHSESIQIPQGFITKRTFTETHGTCEDCQK